MTTYNNSPAVVTFQLLQCLVYNTMPGHQHCPAEFYSIAKPYKVLNLSNVEEIFLNQPIATSDHISHRCFLPENSFFFGVLPFRPGSFILYVDT
jgi:hypothetical protein